MTTRRDRERMIAEGTTTVDAELAAVENKLAQAIRERDEARRLCCERGGWQVSNFDPIPRLQQIAATIEDGRHFDAPATAAHYINCAIREIERLRRECGEARREIGDSLQTLIHFRQERDALREERDAARRQFCTATVSRPFGSGTIYNCGDAEEEATRRGWDCFKRENGK